MNNGRLANARRSHHQDALRGESDKYSASQPIACRDQHGQELGLHQVAGDGSQRGRLLAQRCPHCFSDLSGQRRLWPSAYRIQFECSILKLAQKNRRRTSSSVNRSPMRMSDTRICSRISASLISDVGPNSSQPSAGTRYERHRFAYFPVKRLQLKLERLRPLRRAHRWFEFYFEQRFNGAAVS